MKVTPQQPTGNFPQGLPQESVGHQPADAFSERDQPTSSADAAGARPTASPALAAPAASSDAPLAHRGATPPMANETVEQHQALRAMAPGDVAGNLTAQIQLIQSSATQLATAISNVATLVGGTPGVDIYTNASTIVSDIGGSTASIQAALDALSTILVNNTNYSSDLCTQASSLGANIDNSLSSLPAGATYATVTAGASNDGSGGVNITFNVAGASGTYNLPVAVISGGITNGGSLTLTNGSNQIVLYNRSGATISTQAQALRYLASIYPAGTKLAADLSDEIISLKTMLGGTGASARAKTAAVDATLLQSPTGVLSTDAASVQQLIDGGATTVLETGLANVATSIDGSAGVSVAGKIGTPTVNGTASTLAGVLGGSGVDVATRLGDPVAPGGGLAGLVNAPQATDNNSLWVAGVSSFANATTLNDQLMQFLALFSTGALKSAPSGQIVFQLSSTPPTSLGAFIGSALSTQ